MAMAILSFKFLLVCCVAGFSVANGHRNIHLGNLLNADAETLDFIQHPFSGTLNISLAQKWLHRTVMPEYLQDFVNLLEFSKQEKFEENTRILFQDVASDGCKGHLLEWIIRMANQTNGETRLTSDKDKWVLEMADAWGKLPEGVLTGHVAAVGDFYECIEMEVDNLKIYNKQYPSISKKFEGRYCTSYILDYGSAMQAVGRPVTEQAEKNTGTIGVKHAVSVEELLNIISVPTSYLMIIPSVATCMPNSCSQQDVQTLLVNAVNLTYSALNAFTGIPPRSLPWPVTVKCQESKKPDFDAPFIVVVTIISVITFVSLLAGIVDYWQNHEVENPPQRGLAYQYFMAFSVYTNTKRWLSTRRSSDDMGCIHGIRFLSTCWVLLGHGYGAFAVSPIWNYVDVKKMYESWTVMTVLQANLAVDTFFVMSGALATVGILKTLDKTKGQLNLIMMYVHRYVRLTPTYAIMVGMGATIFNYVGNGPGWDTVETSEEKCRKYWWTNILYVNNLFHIGEMCNAESWYLANDMQFYMLSPFIVYPIWRWKKLGVGCLIVYTVLSWIAPFTVAYITGAPAPALMTGLISKKQKWTSEMYIRPWSRIHTYIVGIWLGLILYKTKGIKVKLPKLVVAGLWLASLGLALAPLFGLYEYFNPKNVMPDVARYFYAPFGRTSWAVSISIIIFCCVKGYGGIVNVFLSWNVFMPLARLSFCVYMISVHVMSVYHSRIATPARYDPYIMTNLFFSHIVMSCLAGFICTLLFESPFIILQKLIFEGGRRPVVSVKAHEKKPQ